MIRVLQRTKSVLLSITLAAISHMAYGQLNGTYTIGGTTPDYATITDAISALSSQGINGAVIFNIRSGVYNEQLIIPEVNGASAVHTIVFQSEQQDSATVTIESAAAQFANYVIRLDGADYITFRYLTIKRIIPGSSGSRVIVMENNSGNNRIEYSHLKGKYSTSVTQNEIIFSSSSVDSANWITGNKIENGGAAVYFAATDTFNAESNNRIQDNTISNIFMGIQAIYQQNLLIAHNNITTSGYLATGLLVNECIKNMSISGNTLNCSLNSYGLEAGNIYPGSGYTAEIVNNMVAAGGFSALGVSHSHDIHIYYNSIRNNGASTTNAAIFSYCTALVYNNVFSHFNGGAALYGSYASIISNYNDLYTNGNLLVNFEGLYFATLEAWQNAFLEDAHSVSTKPNFVSSIDLHITVDIDLNANALPVSVTTDIDGETRSATPDIGADEFSQPGYDAGVLTVTGPELRVCPGNAEVIVNFRNYGEQVLTSLTLHWSANGEWQDSANWTGSATTGDTVFNVPVGTIEIMQDSTYEFKVWTTNPDGIADVIYYNDTALYGLVKTRMKGIYTIGGTDSSYATFASSVTDLIDRQVCGGVTFNVRPGTYYESILIPAITGTSDSSWITWQAEDLDSSSAILSLSSGPFSPFSLITVDDASYIRFRSLTLQRTGYWPGYANTNIISAGGAHIIIEHCHLINPLANSLDFMLSLGGHDLIIRSCRFDSGGLAISIGSVSSDLQSNIVIANNDFYYTAGTGLTLAKLDSLVISGNYFYNDSIVMPWDFTGFGAMFLDLIGPRLWVYDNKIEGRYEFGMKFLACEGDSDAPQLIYNNFLSCGGGMSNPAAAMHFFLCNHVSILHNNVKMYNYDSPYLMTVYNYTLYIFDAGHYNINNNIFEGDSANWIVYYANLPTFDSFDYNVFFADDPTTKINNWNDVWFNDWNAHSVYTDPQFYSVGDLHIQNQSLKGSGIFQGITTDIDGQLRGTPPCIGADEFAAFDISPEDPVANPLNCDSMELVTNVINEGTDTIYYFQIFWVIDGVDSGIYEWSGMLLPGETISGLLLHTLSAQPGTVYHASIITTNPNAATDMQPLNDSIDFNFSYAMAYVNLGPDTSLCPGTSITLHAGSGFTSYEWSGGQTTPNLVVAAAGEYSVTVTNSAGCIAYDTIVVSFYLSAVPEITLQNDTLYSNFFSGNQWYKNNAIINGATDYFYVPTSSGTYKVKHTDTNNCLLVSNSISVVFSGVTETDSSHLISLYPNPASSVIFLSGFSDLFSTHQIAVLDLSGRKIFFQKIAAGQNYIDVTSLPEGMYLLEVKNEYEVIFMKFQVLR